MHDVRQVRQDVSEPVNQLQIIQSGGVQTWTLTASDNIVIESGDTEVVIQRADLKDFFWFCREAERKLQ